MQKFIKIHSSDNVAVALEPLTAHSELILPSGTLLLTEDIPQGHKFALCNLPEGAPVIKYGAQIGTATKEIPTGSWVHTHNIHTNLDQLLTYTYDRQATPLPSSADRTFQGYRRAMESRNRMVSGSFLLLAVLIMSLLRLNDRHSL